MENKKIKGLEDSLFDLVDQIDDFLVDIKRNDLSDKEVNLIIKELSGSLYESYVKTVDVLKPEVKTLDSRFEEGFSEFTRMIVRLMENIYEGNYIENVDLIESVSDDLEDLFVDIQEFKNTYKSLDKFSLMKKMKSIFDGLFSVYKKVEGDEKIEGELKKIVVLFKNLIKIGEKL